MRKRKISSSSAMGTSYFVYICSYLPLVSSSSSSSLPQLSHTHQRGKKHEKKKKKRSAGQHSPFLSAHIHTHTHTPLLCHGEIESVNQVTVETFTPNKSHSPPTSQCFILFLFVLACITFPSSPGNLLPQAHPPPPLNNQCTFI